MPLRDQLNADMKDAMKSGDKRKLGTIRLMNAAIKDKDINSRTEGHDSEKVSDATIMDVFARMVKITANGSRAVHFFVAPGRAHPPVA